MDIKRAGYYKWVKRKDELNSYEEKREVLKPLILEWHRKYPSYGYHDIAAKLRAHNVGFNFSDNLIHKCCKCLNVKSKAKHYQYKKSGGEHRIYSNKVNGNWNANKPLDIIVSDMTVLSNKGKKYEWTYFLDTYNNEIISSHFSSKHGDVKPYYQCLDDLLKRLNKKQTMPTILHTDQGTVYSSRAYEEAHQDYNIERSMSRAGTPTDNPIIESLNGWIKAEMACDFHFWKIEDFDSFMKWYVRYFNTERPSSKLHYKTPIQFKTEMGFG